MFTRSRKHLKYVIEVVPWYAKFQPNVQKYLLILATCIYQVREGKINPCPILNTGSQNTHTYLGFLILKELGPLTAKLALFRVKIVKDEIV